jgi:multiple sugar transport system ATP-binding protein
VASVELTTVSKSYGAVRVIDALSLAIGSGELVVFLGPSGCGKSTLLRMIAGLETVDDGSISIGGRRVDRLAPGDRGVAMVFQHYALYPHMSVRQNMAFGLRNVRLAPAEIERRIADAARVLEIEQLLDRKPGQLSGGQKQRVAIGRAIVKEPLVFLFDEPLSNLDAALRGRTRVEIAQLHQRMASTMIFVTHDQVEAMTLADRIVVLNDGRIEQIGTPMEIYARPHSTFVAGFVGSPKINLLPAAVEANGTAARALIGRDIVIDLPLAGLRHPARFVTLGVRAEAVTVGGGGPIEGTARVVERLGDRTLVHVELATGQGGAGPQIMATDRGDSRVAVGDQVAISIDPTAVTLFDAAGRSHHAGLDDD